MSGRVNHSEFEEVYSAYSDVVLKTAYHYAEDTYVAQEIMQSVFLKLYNHFNNIDKSKIGSWLITTTRNESLNYVKKKQREIVVEEIAEDYDRVPSAEETVLGNLKNQKTKALKENIFADLYQENIRWYDAITLVYCLKKPQEEAAKELNMNIGTLHAVLHRARRWIQKKYKVLYEKLEDE